MPDAIDKILSELSLNTPQAQQRIVQGFARRTQLTPEQEKQFQIDAIRMGYHPHQLDDPTYDMRAAWLKGDLPDRSKNPTVHGSSEYKGLGDDRLFLPIGAGGRLLDTRTAQPTNDPNIWTGPTPDPRLLSLWRAVSGVMNAK